MSTNMKPRADVQNQVRSRWATLRRSRLANLAAALLAVGQACANAWAAAVFFPEATYLAQAASGELEAPQELVTHVYTDLSIIRATFPHVTDIRHHPSWIPGQVTVQLGFDAFPRDPLARTNAPLVGADLDLTVIRPLPIPPTKFPYPPMIQPNPIDQLLEKVGGYVDMDYTSGRTWLIRHDLRFNSNRLAEDFAALPGVNWALASRVIGDGDNIELSNGVYTFTRGRGDCLSGCIFKQQWRFVVTDGKATMTPEPGSAILALLALPAGIGYWRSRRRQVKS